MCGIYIALERSGNAAQQVCDGLCELNYRGKDSYGIAIPRISDTGINFDVIKGLGPVPKDLEMPEALLAMGHIRWATHGGVTIPNAHPHLDCEGRIALIHNGIVENHEPLRKYLKELGHIFRSETDTEVIVHLLEQIEREQQLQFALALRETFSMLHGYNAILATNGYEVVGARKGSPMVLGQHKNGLVACSDPNGILKITKDLYFPAEDEVIVLNGKAERLIPGTNNREEIKFKTESWEYQDQGMGEFPHYMLKEIYVQQQSLEILRNNPKQIKEVAEELRGRDQIALLGCGSANNAAQIGKYLLAKYAPRRGRTIITEAASEYNDFADSLSENSTVLAISQSGETIDLIEQVNAAKKAGASVTAILNSFGSTLYREVDHKIMLEAGIEKAILATKSFTHMVEAFVLLATELGDNPELGQQIVTESIDSIKELLNNEEKLNHIKWIADSISQKEHMYVIGRGISSVVAKEAALKIKEGSYLHAEAYEGGELKHGPIALIEEDFPILVIAPDDEPNENKREEIISNAIEVRSRGARVIGLGSENNEAFDYFIEVQKAGASSIIPNIVATQIFAYFVAKARGVDPDNPRNLAKSVTVK